MPESTKITVQDIRDAINLGLPLLDAIARHTPNKYDDIVVVVLRVIANNDDIAKAIEAAIPAA